MELQVIQSKIFEIRGQRVMLDYDLAELYQVENKRLKASVRRNLKRFPDDFMFELTKAEYDFLRTKFSSLEIGRGKYAKYLPYAFTEQGIAMLSSVLLSDTAIEINILIMRAFVKLRELTFGYAELKRQFEQFQLDTTMQIAEILDILNDMAEKQKGNHRPIIGFKKDEEKDDNENKDDNKEEDDDKSQENEDNKS